MITDREQSPGRPILRLISYAQQHRRVVAALVYTGISTGSLGLAYLVRSDFDPEALFAWPFNQALLILLLVRLGVNYLFSLGLGRWRYVGIRDFGRLLVATTIGSIIFFAFIN